MRKTNPAIADEEVSKIISEVDLDGDGTINFDGKSRTKSSGPFSYSSGQSANKRDRPQSSSP